MTSFHDEETPCIDAIVVEVRADSRFVKLKPELVFSGEDTVCI